MSGVHAKGGWVGTTAATRPTAPQHQHDADPTATAVSKGRGEGTAAGAEGEGSTRGTARLRERGQQRQPVRDRHGPQLRSTSTTPTRPPQQQSSKRFRAVAVSPASSVNAHTPNETKCAPRRSTGPAPRCCRTSRPPRDSRTRPPTAGQREPQGADLRPGCAMPSTDRARAVVSPHPV
eukprot:1580043-Prymnesium_polylepis.1